MTSSELAYLIIEEETDTISSRRINKLESILTKLNINCVSSQDKEFFINLFSDDVNEKPNYIIINKEINNFKDLIQKINSEFPDSVIILLYSSYSNDSLPMIKIDYSIKYTLERNEINFENIESLFFKIKSDIEFQQKIQKYSFIKNLSSGVLSIIDLYNDNQLPRQVVIKKMYIKDSQIKPEDAESEKNRMMKIKAPNLIELYDLIAYDNYRFICMEYAEQKTLKNKIKEMIKERKELNEEEIFDIFIQILLGLYALNEKGYMHQDIKTENILLKTQKNGDKNNLVVKLSEMGFSRKLDKQIGSKTSFGTPYYLSPEMANDEEKYDFNSDIWSLGVVLYEMSTTNLPWFQPKINHQEFLKLIINKKKAPLPENFNEKIKYLLKIMLIKDPERRATLKEIMTIDFVYEKIETILNKYDWWKYYEGIKDLKKDAKPCYLFLDLLSSESINYLSDASKIFTYCQNNKYNQGYFSSSCNLSKNGKDILDLFSDLKKWGSYSINYKTETPKDFLNYLLSNQVIRCISHPIKNFSDRDEISDFINNFINDPSKYIFQNTSDFDQNQLIDNKKIINFEICKYKNDIGKIDFLLLSQFILNNGLNLYNKSIKNNTEIELLSSDKNYLNFLFGISLFQECDIFEIPYNSNNKSRLAFLLNIYQIMLLHFAFNEYQNYCKKKGSILSFLSSEETINYQFKNFTLNNLEIKHVIFRNNKKIPGRVFRLVYQSDKKCQILPNFNNLKPLLMLYDLNKDISSFIFKIFNAKEVEQQLDDITYKFITLKMVLSSEEELLISSHIKYILKDFGETNTEQNPKEFLFFLVKFLEKEKKLKAYKSRIKEEDKIFLNKNFVNTVEKGNIKILYV